MQVLTLKIPDDLAAALQAASRARGVSKSALVRDALMHALPRVPQDASAAQSWLDRWRGRLSAETVADRAAGFHDPRLAHILDKHLR